MKKISLALLSGVLLQVGGCATITRGTTENLVIQTEPANATATLSSGHICKTPCTIELKHKNDVHVILEKAGYERVDTDVKSEIAGAGAAAMAGNVILGGIIGGGVDMITGATKRLTPNPLVVKLDPIVAVPVPAAALPVAPASMPPATTAPASAAPAAAVPAGATSVPSTP